MFGLSANTFAISVKGLHISVIPARDAVFRRDFEGGGQMKLEVDLREISLGITTFLVEK
jgi:hypothetical protein